MSQPPTSVKGFAILIAAAAPGASSASSYVTGHTLMVDGGWTAG